MLLSYLGEEICFLVPLAACYIGVRNSGATPAGESHGVFLPGKQSESSGNCSISFICLTYRGISYSFFSNIDTLMKILGSIVGVAE
jgi:hypothetical protein